MLVDSVSTTPSFDRKQLNYRHLLSRIVFIYLLLLGSWHLRGHAEWVITGFSAAGFSAINFPSKVIIRRWNSRWKSVIA